MTAFVSAEIFDDEPWRLCGAQTLSGERRKFVRRDASLKARSGISLALSHQRMAVKTAGQTAPVKAVSRRSRSRGARALRGVGWSGNACQAIIASPNFSIACSTAEVRAALRSRLSR
jgi:hypothetical protein